MGIAKLDFTKGIGAKVGGGYCGYGFNATKSDMLGEQDVTIHEDESVI